MNHVIRLLGLLALLVTPASLVAITAAMADDTATESSTRPSKDEIRTWVEQLADENFQVRASATQRLIEAGELAVPQIVQALDNKDAEVRSRASAIIKRWVEFEDESAFQALEKISPKVSPNFTTKMRDFQHIRSLRLLREGGYKYTFVSDTLSLSNTNTEGRLIWLIKVSVHSPVQFNVKGRHLLIKDSKDREVEIDMISGKTLSIMQGPRE